MKYKLFLLIMTTVMMTAIALSQEQSEDYSIREWDAKGLGLQNQQRRPQYIYLEENVPAYDLPDPLVSLDGKKVRNTRTRTEKRRPEILELFETHVYGKSPDRSKNMTFNVFDDAPSALGGKARRRKGASAMLKVRCALHSDIWEAVVKKCA